MVLLSHPTGNENVRHAACALLDSGLLEEFMTCLVPTQNSIWLNLLPPGLRARYLRRQIPRTLRPYVRSRPWRELSRFAASALRISILTRHEVGWCSIDGVYRDLDRAAAARVNQIADRLSAVYAYEDGALQTFRAAAEHGLKRIYDLPIAYWKAGREIFLDEAEREPEWAGTLDGLSDSNDKLDRKDEEIQLADRILVASSFTRDSLAQTAFPPSSIQVIPYGAPEPIAAPRPSTNSRVLRVLFVGSLGQRKGTAYLLRACEHLKLNVGLTLIGNKPAGRCAPIEAALRRHRWIASCTHSRVLEEMQNHDVLVFPSLFEGFGLVILEAMSQGMTVITTPNTGGPDVITDGKDGFIVPIRSVEAIAERLEWLVRDPDRLAAMRGAALETARRLSWKSYETAVSNAVKGIIQSA